MKIYVCPSRPPAVLSTGDFANPGGALTDYAASFGTEALYTESNGALIPNLPHVAQDAGGRWAVTSWSSQTNLASITDGTSNTTLFGEKHIRPNSLRGKNEDRSVSGGNRNNAHRMMGTSPNGGVRPLLPPTAQNNALANSSFGGPHTDVCNFVFVDGSVHAIRTSATLQTLTALVTRSGNEVLDGNDY